MSSFAAQEHLTQDLTVLQQKMHAPMLKTLGDDFARRQRTRAREARTQERTARRRFGRKAATPADRRDPQRSERRELHEFLVLSIEQLLERLRGLHRQHAEFRRLFAGAPSERERRRLILDYARYLGASPRQLRADARALDRWCGEDAMNDRYARRKGAAEQKLVFCLDRLGTNAAATFMALRGPDVVGPTWNRLALERLTRVVTQYRGDPRVEMAALRCLSKAVGGLPDGVAAAVFANRTRLFVERAALDTHRDVAVQCAALDLLRLIAPRKLDQVLAVRLRQPTNGESQLVHRRCVRLLGERIENQPELIELITSAADNPSSFVRQQLAGTVVRLPANAAIYWLHRLAIEDRDPKVRAATLLTALEHDRDDALVAAFHELLLKVFSSETDQFVLRTALYVAAQYHALDRRTGGDAQPESAGRNAKQCDDSPAAKVRRGQMLAAIRRLQTTAGSLPVRRWSAQAAERIWTRSDSAAARLLTALRQRLAGLRPGRSRWISKRSLGGCDELLLGRVLAVLAQDDYGYDAQRSWWGYRVTRGPVFRFRTWRLLHELFTPAPDKRQAFSHTIGRVSEATIRAPSQILAELSETKVPGEPLFMMEEGGWRPYLPLPDDFLSALHIGLGRPRPVRFFTSEGVTEVAPPKGLLKNSLAYCRLTLRFARYARPRNWRDGDGSSPRAYLERFTRLGFRLRFQPYDEESCQTAPKDKSVLRFFPLACGVALPLNQYFFDFADYFFSLFENSVPQLLAFLIGTVLVFLAHHVYANWTLRQARQAIGLSIGGWGTRGKSGTERLKAALFNALGCGVVSKSSGCEAMFMFGAPFGELRELLLYRPGDKATIWEHRRVLSLASQLEATVFLWECMGLTPAYVDVLQQQWSRDDLSTITNAYPDHEDLQGPAGWNVAQVISGFVPHRTRLLTSEQQMLPQLRDACRKMGTSMRSVGWLESGLLTDDILERFPYKVHPDNVALVLALADELGCDRDYALKEMADRLVPDLGVLKTYPIALIRTRLLEFTNGMSANERFGCLGNWQRMGFDRHDYVAEPQTWISTVVNNRADRVPRSRVFAAMLVNDLEADRHFLIGTNLKGLQGFIWIAFERMLDNLSLWRDDSDDAADDALEIWHRTARRFRQPTDGAQVQAALTAMLDTIPNSAAQHPEQFSADEVSALWKEPQAVAQELTRSGAESWFVKSVVSHLTRLLAALEEYTTLADHIRKGGSSRRAEIERVFHKTLRRWFERKLVVIDNHVASGDEIIKTIGEETPPGFLNRIMGLQNIKGTGMDFVYRWQSWEKCHHACQLLQQTKPALAERGLEMLTEFQDFGVLCEDHLRSTLSAVRSSPVAQRERFQAELDALVANTNVLSQTVHGAMRPTRPGRFAQKVLELLEQFANVTDAVRRRKKADQIYRDLAHERIGAERAILELRALNKRQQGGWLTSKLRSARLPLPNVPFASRRRTSRPADVESEARARKVDAQPTAVVTPNADNER